MDEFRRRLMMTPKSSEIDYENYLTIEALEDGLEVSFTNDLYYNKDGEWVLLSAGSSTPPIASGKKIAFKAELTPIGQWDGIGTFTITKGCNLLGNCMSMLFGDNANGVVSLSGYNYAFSHLFSSCSTVVSVSQNFLPATTLSTYCYYNMFNKCTSLISAPSLPASVMLQSCYYGMFSGCTSLTSAPTLNSTRLAKSCYYSMFNKCTSLTSAPSLPATILYETSYASMFRDCTSLVKSPGISATTLASRCCYYMFYNCRGLTSAPTLSATTLAEECYSDMFRSCVSLSTAPNLTATTLTTGCYYNMFNGCSKLSSIKMLATDISASRCLSNWMQGVASSGTFTKSKKATWSVTGASGIPSGWTVKTA